MGKIEKFITDTNVVSICGNVVEYPESLRTIIDFERMNGMARVTLMLPRKDRNANWLDDFRLLVDIINIDPKSEDANALCYKLLNELKKNFAEIEVSQGSIVPTFMAILFYIPASEKNSITIVERKYSKLINILKKY